MAWQFLDFLLPGAGTVLDLAVGGKEGAQNYHENDPIANVWKGMTGQLSDEMINDRNLQYQRERNDIEDARYDEETSYNRAFAEDERAYERAFAENEREYQRNLQQQLFEREDTAMQRQADDMRAAGINPLSQNLSGAGAGQPLSGVSAPLADMPGSSSRGGQALHEDLIGRNLLTSALGLADSIGNLYGNSVQNDALREQTRFNALKNQMLQMENLVYADKNNITIGDDGSLSLGSSFVKEQDFSETKKKTDDANAVKAGADASRSLRVDAQQEKYGTTDLSTDVPQTLADIGSMADAAARAVTEFASEPADEPTYEPKWEYRSNQPIRNFIRAVGNIAVASDKQKKEAWSAASKGIKKKQSGATGSW